MTTENINPNAKRTMVFMGLLATFGSLLFGYDTGVINGALPYMARPDQLNLTPVLEGLVGSAICIGAAIGSFISGRLSDTYGRKTTLSYLSILFFLASLGCVLSVNAQMMIGCRFFLGLAVGGSSVIVPGYLAEIATSQYRGRMVGLMDLVVVFGQFLAYIVNAVIALNLGHDPHVWRYILAVTLIPAILLFLSMLIAKESPRYLVAKGRVSDALEVLKCTHETQAQAIAELNNIKDVLEQQNATKELSFKDFTEPWMKRIFILGIALAVTQQVTGVNSIMFYGSQILTHSGFSTDAALVGNIGNGIISVAGALFGLYIVGKIGRRTMLTIGLCGVLTANILIGVISSTLEGSPLLPYFILTLTVIFLGFQQSCVSPATWLMISEIFPTRMRSTCMGLTVLCLWCTNFLVTLIFPILLGIVGISNTFFIFGALCVCSLIFVRTSMPETKHLSIEDIERKFRSEYK